MAQLYFLLIPYGTWKQGNNHKVTIKVIWFNQGKKKMGGRGRKTIFLFRNIWTVTLSILVYLNLSSLDKQCFIVLQLLDWGLDWTAYSITADNESPTVEATSYTNTSEYKKKLCEGIKTEYEHSNCSFSTEACKGKMGIFTKPNHEGISRDFILLWQKGIQLPEQISYTGNYFAENFAPRKGTRIRLFH